MNQLEQFREQCLNLVGSLDCAHRCGVGQEIADKIRAETARQIEELQALTVSAEKWRGLALAKSGDGRILSEFEREKAEAVAAEREACAKVCSDLAVDENDDSWTITRCMAFREAAEAIRARGAVALKGGAA